MKRKLRVSLAALMVAMMATVAGCGGGEAKKDAPAPQPAGDKQTAPAPAAKPDFKLGVTLPFSGVYAQLGNDITDGMNLYFDSVKNTAGGRKIAIVKEDTEANNDVGVRKTKKLIEQDKVDMITGYVSSGVAMAIRDVVHEAKVPTVISNAGADPLSGARKSPYIFRTSFTNWQVAAIQGKYAAEKLGKKAVTLNPDYQAGKDNVAAFKGTFEAGGGKILKEIYPPLGNNDYAPYLAQVKAENPDFVFAFFSGSDAVRFVKQWNEYGLKDKVALICNGFMVEEDVLPQQGEAAVGILSALGWAYTVDNPENKAFVKAYEDKYKRRPSVFAVQGYETAQFIVEALNKVNGDTANQQKLLDTMKTTTFKAPRGEFKLDPENQNIILTMYIRKVDKVDGHLTNKVLETTPNWKYVVK